MTVGKIAKHLQAMVAQQRAVVDGRPADVVEVEVVRPDQSHRARWWVTYPGDARGMVGVVCGPTEKVGSENVVAVAAELVNDPFSGTYPSTRVGFAIATVPDVVEHNRRVDEQLALQARVQVLLGSGLAVSA